MANYVPEEFLDIGCDVLIIQAWNIAIDVKWEVLLFQKYVDRFENSTTSMSQSHVYITYGVRTR